MGTVLCVNGDGSPLTHFPKTSVFAEYVEKCVMENRPH